MNRSYIARSVLSDFILESAQTWDKRIAGLSIEFANEVWQGANWRVVSIDPGEADPDAAHAVVARIVRGNSAWVMVEDDSPLDGQIVR